MLNRFKIRTKLGAGFAIVILLLLVLAVVMAYSFSSIGVSSTKVTESVDRANTINTAIQYALRMQRDFLSYLATKNPQDSLDFEENLEKARASIEVIYNTALIEANKNAAKEIMDLFDDVSGKKKAFLAQEQTVRDIAAGGTSHARAGISGIDELVKAINESVANDKNVDADLFHLAHKVMEAKALVPEVLLRRDNLLTAQTAEAYAKYGKEFPEFMGKLIAALEEIKPITPPKFVDQLDKCTKEFITWKGIAENFVKNLQALYELRAPLIGEIGKSIETNSKMVERVTALINKEGDNQHHLIAKSQIWGYLISTLAVLFGIVICVILTRDITGGIHRAVSAIRLMAEEGNVDFEISSSDLNSHDEVGDLARAFGLLQHQLQTVEQLAKDLAEGNYTVTLKIRSEQDSMNIYLDKMIDQASTALREISEGVKQVTTGSEEVSSAAQTLSGGAQSAAASLEEITASMGEIGGQTKKNAEGATQARDLSQKASKAAGDGQKAMHEMTDAMERIMKNSHEIQRVIKVIDDIAFQTNLLALNAAVEAARAGAHGKGFAVVAEEVRNLAARSAKAAQETSELIAKSGQEIDKGGEVASRTAEVLNTIVDQVQQTTGLIAEIAVASNEQAQGVNQVTTGLQQIDVVTQQNTASAEESASAANEMSAMSINLQKLVAQFTLRA
jgi:methyl-accepting chemotaxis protein